MSKGDLFCIVCGDPPPLTSDKLCEACFRARNYLSKFPERIQQIRCPKCDMFLIDGRFGRMEHDDLMEYRAMEALSVHPDAQNLDIEIHADLIDDRTSRLTILIKGEIEGFQFEYPF